MTDWCTRRGGATEQEGPWTGTSFWQTCIVPPASRPGCVITAGISWDEQESEGLEIRGGATVPFDVAGSGFDELVLETVAVDWVKALDGGGREKEGRE